VNEWGDRTQQDHREQRVERDLLGARPDVRVEPPREYGERMMNGSGNELLRPLLIGRTGVDEHGGAAHLLVRLDHRHPAEATSGFLPPW
jgi:hypothetical protein